MKHLRLTYYQKIVFSHLLVLVLTLSIMAAFNYAFSRDQQNRRMLDVVSYSGQQTAAGIEARLNQMVNVSEMVRYTLQQTLSDTSTTTPRPQTQANAMSTIRTLRDSFDFMDIAAWMPSSFFSSGEGITFFNIAAQNGRGQMEAVRTAPVGRLCWMVLEDYAYPFMRFATNQRYNLITCFMRVSTLTSPGAFCFFIDINEREIAALLGGSEGTPIEQFIVDDAGRILSHSDEAMRGQTVPETVMTAAKERGAGDGPLRFNQTAYMSYPLADTGWYLMVAVPDSFLNSVTLTSPNGLVPAVIIASLVAVLASLVISRQLTQKMKGMEAVIRSIEPSFSVLTEAVEMIDARLPEPPEGTAPDVLDELAIVFNKLVERLNATMQTALSSSLTQEKLRYQLLRAKINPHFLYNMLDSIKICNSLGRTEDANLMLSRLASFYRLILRKNDLDIITIGEELEIIRLYLEMEAISHEHAFSFRIETDPDVELFAIPRFVLQPLVENCVTHGLPGDAKHMTIEISLRYEEDAIRITIRDNGLGMDEENMKRLMRVVCGEEAPPQKGSSTAFYGLYNVSSRLKPYVMEAQEPVHYESAVGEGTTVVVMLRQILQDD
ncbi:MAG: histidine kinase [Eubacteriales bacterium]|nr:histidine kinase [Eubacteriales bacterium]